MWICPIHGQTSCQCLPPQPRHQMSSNSALSGGLSSLFDELEDLAMQNDLPIADGLGYFGTGLPLRILGSWISEKRKSIEKAT